MKLFMKIQEKEAEIKAFNLKHYDSNEGFTLIDTFMQWRKLKRELVLLRSKYATSKLIGETK